MWLPSIRRYILIVLWFRHNLIINCLERTIDIWRFEGNVVCCIAREDACLYIERLSVKFGISAETNFICINGCTVWNFADGYLLLQRTDTHSVSVHIDVGYRIVFDEVAVAAIRIAPSITLLHLAEPSIWKYWSNSGGCDLHFVA